MMMVGSSSLTGAAQATAFLLHLFTVSIATVILGAGNSMGFNCSFSFNMQCVVHVYF